MKKNSNFVLKLLFGSSLAFAAIVGIDFSAKDSDDLQKATAEETKTLKIERSSVTTTKETGYELATWTVDAGNGVSVSGKVDLSTGETTCIQMNKGSGSKIGAVYNTLPIPGTITAIRGKASKTTYRAFNAYVSSTPYSFENSALVAGENATKLNASAVTINNTDVTIGTSTAGYSYFCIQENVNNAAYISYFEIDYVASSKTLESVAVSGTPTKTDYLEGESFNPTGLTLTGTYSDASTADLTSSATWTVTPETLALGTTSVSVVGSAGGKTSAAYTVDGLTVTKEDENVLYDATKQGYADGAVVESWEENTINVAFSAGTNSNAPKYYNSGTAIRTYGGNTYTISSNTYKFTKVEFTYSQRSNDVTASVGTFNSDFTSWEGSSKSVTFTVSGTSGHNRLQKIKMYYVESVDPNISITNAPTSNLEVGATGTLQTEVLRATNPVVTWSSSNSDVLSINSSTGAFEAKAYGTAVVTASLTCDEGTTSASATINVNGTVSVKKALEIISSLQSGESTSYKVSVSGTITNLNAGNREAGKENAFTLTDGADSLMIFGIYSDNTLRQYAIVGGTASFKGALYNYNGNTPEMTGSQLVSGTYVDAAMTYAKAAYESLNTACEQGTQAVTDSAWTSLAADYATLSNEAKAKLQAATSSYAYSEDIAKWSSRYSIIVSSGKTNFMEKEPSQLGLSMINRDSSDNSLMMLIATMSVITLGGVAMYVYSRRKSVAK